VEIVSIKEGSEWDKYLSREALVRKRRFSEAAVRDIDLEAGQEETRDRNRLMPKKKRDEQCAFGRGLDGKLCEENSFQAMQIILHSLKHRYM
jgi:hypothetical protein